MNVSYVYYIYYVFITTVVCFNILSLTVRLTFILRAFSVPVVVVVVDVCHLLSQAPHM